MNVSSQPMEVELFWCQIMAVHVGSAMKMIARFALIFPEWDKGMR